MLSDSPPERDINWSISGIQGSWKFCQKVYTLIDDNKLLFNDKTTSQEISVEGRALLVEIHQNLDEITKSIEKFQMNVAVAKIYEMVNHISKFISMYNNCKTALKESLKILIRIIEPMIPHLAEECWALMSKKSNLNNEPWPDVNKEFLIKSVINMVIQINGKRRGEIKIAPDTSESEILEKIYSIKNIADMISDKDIKKSIFVPNKIINIVI